MTHKTRVESLNSVFEGHLEEHRKLPESSRQRDLGSERELIRNYSGRVVFELLQNALDRAGKNGCPGRILVALIKNENGKPQLIVGNDGAGVSVYPRPKAGEIGKHSDFHAMLSLHASTKTAEESIGNKGIGFRSVFSSSESVYVYSRESLDGAWWGFDLQHPAKCEKGADWTTDQTASFYAPKLIALREKALSSGDLSSNLALPPKFGQRLSELVTLVVLPELSDETSDGSDDVHRAIEFLSDRSKPLHFLKERTEPNVRITFYSEFSPNADFIERAIRENEKDERWIFVDAGEVFLDDAFKETTGLELDKATVDLGMPPVRSDSSKARTYFWSYLPTEQPAGFGVHINGDFYLMNSRRGVSFAEGKGKTPQNFNYRLLEKAADAIVHDLWKRPEVQERSDFWKLARPSACDSPELKSLVAQRFLEKDVFQEIVRGAFNRDSGSKWCIERYQDFFHALYDWIDLAYKSELASDLGGRKKHIKAEIIGWLKESQAHVLPIVADPSPEQEISTAVGLPLIEERKRDKTVYLKGSEEEGDLVLPENLSARCNLYVTRFAPDSFDAIKHIGMTRFNRVEILKQVTPGDSESDYRESLGFALQLIFQNPKTSAATPIAERILKDPENAYPSWRFKAKKKNEGSPKPLLEAGISISKLHVPVKQKGSNTWVPAGEATWLPFSVRKQMRDTNRWPWPLLDEERMKPFWAAIELEMQGDADKLLTEVCTILGVSVGPLIVHNGHDIAINGFENLTDATDQDEVHDLAVSILMNWERSFRPLIETWSGIEASLLENPWLPKSISQEAAGGDISVPKNSYKENGGIPPLNLWLMPGGDVTDLLYGLRVREENSAPQWANDLHIVKLGTRGHQARTIRALECLKKRYAFPSADGTNRKLEEVYRRLVRTIDDNDDSKEYLGMPVLIQDRKPGGGLKEIRWRREEERCWFDNGKYRWLMNAFTENTQWWVVRSEKAKLAEKLEIKPFEPYVVIQPENATAQTDDKNRSESCFKRIRAALPYLMTAASVNRSGSAEFKEDEALDKWRKLTANRRPVRYLKDVWWDVSFDGIKGQIGKSTYDDVFFDQENNVILFDTPDPPLLWFARPLSLAIFGHEAFFPIFSQVLAAWSVGSVTGSDGDPVYLERLKRDLGFSDEEVRLWNGRIESHMLSPEQVERWRGAVRQCMEKHGKLNKEISGPGAMVVNRDTWVEQPETSQEEIEKELQDAFAEIEDASLNSLIPDVRIYASNLSFWEERKDVETNEVMARYLAECGAAAWPERSEEGWLKLNSNLTGDEEKILSRLPFTRDHVRGILEKRLQIQNKVNDSASLEQAKRFLEGKIVLQSDPVEVNHRMQNVHSMSGIDNSAKAPLTEEKYIARQANRSHRGKTAEESILDKAIREAETWISKDSESFWSTLKGLLDNKNCFEQESLYNLLDQNDLMTILEGKDASKIGYLLHVSRWWGNAGFDLLYPENKYKSGRFILAEIKSVRNARQPSFYLSINEIEKGRSYFEGHLRWEVWCVDPSGAYCRLAWEKLVRPDQNRDDNEPLDDLLKKIREKGFVPENLRCDL